MMRQRLDTTLVRLGLAKSRARARLLVERGAVSVDGVVTRDAAASVLPLAQVTLTAPDFPYVSRAAFKLLHALDTFHISPEGLSVLDCGASTGGFTQVLLERGARSVCAVDVGHGQLDPLLRNDPRVQCLEGVDVRALSSETTGVFPLVVADLSFISLRKVLPNILPLIAEGGMSLFLVKPQFEVGKGNTEKGVVRDDALREEAKDAVLADLVAAGLTILGCTESPITGGEGNIEYLVAAKKGSAALIS